MASNARQRFNRCTCNRALSTRVARQTITPIASSVDSHATSPNENRASRLVIRPKTVYLLPQFSNDGVDRHLEPVLTLNGSLRMPGQPLNCAHRALAFLVVLTALSGCAAPAPKSAAPGAAEYRSADYLVLHLESDTTPVELARRHLGDDQLSWVIEDANPGAGFRRGEAIAIPLTVPNRAGLRRDGFQTIPILTYHRFAQDCPSPLCMPTAAFREQMRYLKDNRYHVLTADELLGFVQHRRALPPKSVLITIDDGYRSVYEVAYPILREYGFSAVVFIYTELIDVAPVALTWGQLAEMRRNGFTVGSHTVHHSDLTVPREGESKAEFAARVEDELVGSKRILDRRLGQDTWLLAYPYGNYDSKVVASSRQAGYKLAMSVKRGGNPFFANPYTLKRDQILERDLPTFIKRLKTFNSLALE
jgi:peptidoglycan/xylan/chitin deacetylase (PgdA/CDA1 family)